MQGHHIPALFVDTAVVVTTPGVGLVVGVRGGEAVLVVRSLSAFRFGLVLCVRVVCRNPAWHHHENHAVASGQSEEISGRNEH